MKVALISNPRHRAGDRMEFLLLRAAHWLSRFEPADLLLVTGELTAGNAAPEPGFLEAFYASLARRKSELPVIFPGAVEPVTVCGESLAPAALAGRIREAAGRRILRPLPSNIWLRSSTAAHCRRWSAGR